MHWVTATDENGRDFKALTEHPQPKPEEHVDVWVFVTGVNGWGKNKGELALLSLKKLDDGKFGA